jgi:hypothetical protein
MQIGFERLKQPGRASKAAVPDAMNLTPPLLASLCKQLAHHSFVVSGVGTAFALPLHRGYGRLTAQAASEQPNPVQVSDADRSSSKWRTVEAFADAHEAASFGEHTLHRSGCRLLSLFSSTLSSQISSAVWLAEQSEVTRATACCLALAASRELATWASAADC